MKTQILNSLVILVAGSLVACGNQVSQSVNKAIVDNQNAKTSLEWDQSEANPEILFPQWQEQFMRDSSKREELKKDVCTALDEIETRELTLFENEIRKEQNRALLADCKTDLLAKIEAYYDVERSGLVAATNAIMPKASTNNFKFADNVQKRDTTNGYRAKTGDIGRKEVILTFDDGPSNLYTESILQALKEVNAKAIFFHQGKNVRMNPAIVRKVAADGHSVGSHSVSHSCLGPSAACKRFNGRNLSYDEAVAEIRGGHQAIYDTLGWVDPFFRFPFDEKSPELRYFLKTQSTGEFMWNVDSEDWKATSLQTVLDNTLRQIEALGTGLVLFHDVQRKTAEIMPQFLRELYIRGYSVVLLQPADLNVRYNSKLVRKPTP
ncbi:polysaccharide deacetylase family protein [Bdellovibrio reynosensis]|uniref:Polysaccharide deacetylase family protein n=1 Tax=Bdellovibrio reynosensis TaxID=2835041 RepID=A0ABY4CBB9_9BACT|nr:polysaccharide deacetylase family protein [Bdellovibrio reynosensis]UOF00976.1 polysaccharide deacetylase family protein [Bdellovibrio reynosensis]